MSARRFLNDRSGTASAEMALVLPMLMVLLFTGFEAGHFVWTQHKLVEAVRDGARFASRYRVQELCNGATSIITSDMVDEVRLLTRTGQLASSSAISKVPGWTDDEITVTISCQSFVDTGIYTTLGGAGPVVTVSTGGVQYPSLLNQLGLLDATIQLSARSNAAVIGL
jgi:Flp pilus assembly pilin Flp